MVCLAYLILKLYLWKLNVAAPLHRSQYLIMLSMTQRSRATQFLKYVSLILISSRNLLTYFLFTCINQGTVVMLNLDAVLNDPKYWKDPEVFRPERHLTEDGTKVMKNEHFYAFGLGINIHKYCQTNN